MSNSSLLSFTFWSSLLLVAAQFIAAFAFPEQVWGLHHWAFFPVGVSIAWGVAVALLLLLVRYGPSTWIKRIVSVPWQIPKTAFFAGAVIGSMALFYTFRIQHFLLGDASLIPHLAKNPPEFLWLGENDASLHSFIYRLLSQRVDLDIWSVFAGTSCTAGGVLILTLLLFADSVGISRGQKLFAFFILAGTGAIELSCGYLEHYTLMSLFLVLALLFLVRWQGKVIGYLLAAITCWSAAFLLHPLASFFGPALALAVSFHLWRSAWPLWARSIGLGVLTLGGTAGAFHWISSATSSQSLLIGTGIKGDPSYTLFSVAHLTDTINEYLLLTPLYLPLLLFLLWRRHLKISWQDPVLACLGICLISAWGTSFVIDPQLGCLDWDLLSIYAFPLAALTAYMVGKYSAPIQAARSGWCFALAAFLHVLPWVSINTNRQRAGEMVEAMVANDAHHRGARNTKLAAKFQKIGLLEAAIRQYQRAVEWNKKDYVAYYNLGWCYLMSKSGEENMEKAARVFESFVASAPAGLDTRLAQSALALHSGKTEEGLLLCVSYLMEKSPNSREDAGIISATLMNELAEERHREILQVALFFCQDQIPEALQLSANLDREYPEDRLVVDIGEFLRYKVRTLPEDRRDHSATPP